MKNNELGFTKTRRACLAIMATVATLVIQLVSTAAYAQLPELASPSAATGNSTTAKFFGGATADNGASYASSFAYDQPIDVLTEIQVETAHVNTMGNLYIIIALGETYFIRDEFGAYQVWNVTDPLLAASPAKTLQASEPLTIVEDLAFGPAGVSNAALSIFLAYDTMAVQGELFYSGAPLTFAIEAEAASPASFQLFTDNISTPIIQAKCIVCHTDVGIASAALSTSRLQYLTSAQANFQQTNYDTLVNFIKNIPDGSDLILSKPQGIDHIGLQQLDSSDPEFLQLQEFVNAVVAE